MNTDLTVITYNIHRAQGMDGRYDLQRVADVIERTGADVIGLQEVDKRYDARSDFDDQVQILGDRLGLETAFASTLTRTPEQTPHEEPGNFGVAILSRFPIKERRVTELPHDHDTEPRVLLETELTPTDEPSVTFCTTHFGLQPSESRQQAEQIRETLSDKRRVILTGDFNATPSSAPIESISERFQSYPLSDECAPQSTFPTPYVESAPDNGRWTVSVPERRIDYVFHTDEFVPEAETVIHSLASDHSLVIATLTLPRTD